jgi:hypothetical protein
MAQDAEPSSVAADAGPTTEDEFFDDDDESEV